MKRLTLLFIAGAGIMFSSCATRTCPTYVKAPIEQMQQVEQDFEADDEMM